ncbi:hypothetical protein HGRIS_005497 [Hohenbuehelia grisea]|uniref:Proteasome subunit beta n=1 Tax=Hohenbuehelia grisea TaxID=104357 RepID=A0ABR3JX13_9AGAR
MLSVPHQQPNLHVQQAHGPQQRHFNPYTENGGTILAIAGKDFSVIAGDTRQSEGYSIQTRYAPKVFRLTDRAVLAVNGFAADGNMFVKKVRQRLEWYRHAHAKDMPLRAIARLIQTMLYARRFFPFYVYNILGGIEEDGTGAVYSFDPVGSYEREACRAAGAAQSLVQPFLDNQASTAKFSTSRTIPLTEELRSLSFSLSAELFLSGCYPIGNQTLVSSRPTVQTNPYQSARQPRMDNAIYHKWR